MVTVYAVLLGDFNSAYVFDTSNRLIKGLFFLALQVTMAIAFINLLVAVMTEAYTSVSHPSMFVRAEIICPVLDYGRTENHVQYG